MRRGIIILTIALVIGLVFSGSAIAAQSVQVGAFLPDRNSQAIADYQAEVGRHQDIVMFYQAWGSNGGGLDAERVQWIIANGSVPMITWEPWDWSGHPTNQPDYSLSKIASGSHDAYIRSFARQVKGVDGVIYLRPMHEMNGNWYPWAGTVNGNSPAQYVPAFRHIVDIFRQESVDNVRWVWSPNNGGLPDWGTTSFRSYYPGDAYVDFAAVDGYNAGTTASWSTWTSFSQVFDQAYRTITGFTQKPIIIAETSSAEVGGSKAAWITDAFSQMTAKYPRISAIIWFNENKETDWRVDSSAASLTAYKAALAGLGSPDDPTADITAPTGRVVINNGSSWTDNRRVSLAIRGADTGGSGLSAMRIRNSNGSWQSWRTYTTGSYWNLSTGDGTKRVDVQFKDGAGNVSTLYSDTIVYKAPRISVGFRGVPTEPSITGRYPFTVGWRSTRSPVGVWRYTVKYRTNRSSLWRTIRADTTSTSLRIEGRGRLTYYFRVTARDSRGNTAFSTVRQAVMP